jgi:hypothetical protein
MRGGRRERGWGLGRPTAGPLIGAIVVAATLGAAPASASRLSAPSPAGSGAGHALLITGERVLVGTTPDGTRTSRVVPAGTHRAARQFTSVDIRGDRYVVPAAAQPYLGRYLDPQFFDVTALAAAGVTDRVPLQISFAGGSPPRLPGVTITSTAAGVATGYVTASSAPAFGAALAAQAVRDQAAGWPARSPLFGSATAIAPDVDLAAPDPVTTQRFPQVTLVIKGVGTDGAPIPFGFGFLMNAEDGFAYTGFILMIDGEARVSVPLGTYVGVFDDLSFVPDRVTFRVMPVVDYAVTRDLQTLTVDARTAVATPSVTAPREAVAQEEDVTLSGEDAARHSSWGWGYSLEQPGARMKLAPTGAPSVGTLEEITQWLLVDPNVAGGRYSYNASFSDDGVPVAQDHTIPGGSQAATIHETYDADRPNGSAAVARLVFLPHQFFASAIFQPIPVPLRRADHVYAPPGSTYFDSVLSDASAWDPGFMDGGPHRIRAGTERSETWLRNPYRLGVLQPTSDERYPFCYACRTDTKMTFASFPTDGDPTHAAEVYGSRSGKPVAHFRVYRDGTLLLREQDSLGDVFSVPPELGTYRIETAVSRRLTNSPLSTLLQSVVTFRSAAGTGAQVPDGWSCASRGACTILPVLWADVDLHARSGSLPVGRSMWNLSVGHVTGASAAPIRSVSVRVRRSGTGAWASVPVVLSNAGYAVEFRAPLSWAGRAVDLQIEVHDAGRGSLRQTTHDAFVVSP